MDMPDRRWPPHDLTHTHDGSSWAARISDMKERLESEGKVFRDEEFAEHLERVARTGDDLPGGEAE